MKDRRHRSVTPAQLRRQMRRRPRRVDDPPGWNEAEEELDNALIKAKAMNRMNVFDKAPKHVRDQANAKGEEVVTWWWVHVGSEL